MKTQMAHNHLYMRTDGRMSLRPDRQTDAHTDGPTDGRTDGYKHKHRRTYIIDDGRAYERIFLGYFILLQVLLGVPTCLCLYSVEDTLLSPFHGVKLINKCL